ncbi:hypothetical protein QNI19_30175 [Cytophagaceae bacterium DM2B3-1]|uniref:PKD/Chitinase domain-containing protein n=1 Tax=Xanthocytophaga flava TaxID=3048013 RepID=A0ABT7CXA3_9BACT|nr:PKD domain-containing protein [Xanthocytophaga flavus]MDJ1472532.1 hypothetical protein [Xanthocytophaga flavus]MDJ1497244.1 hypothetical protein [Xanthocytophaga flavus]
MIKKIFFLLYILLIPISLFSCFHEQEIPVNADFEYTITAKSYTVPVELTLTNKTVGADFYKWTFEGASPATSTEKQPGRIIYPNAGTYTIRLEAWNDTQHQIKELVLQLDSAVVVNFETQIEVNDFAPANVKIRNKSRGASTYEWTFEGGIPATSNAGDPPLVYFDQPGDHVITLRVTNGRETFSYSKKINLKESLQTEFTIVPVFEDEDYEAPLTATLENQTRSGLQYNWKSTGGIIANSSSQHTSIHFDSPGEYTITLEANNDKQTQVVQHTIQVKANTNLYTMKDVRLGVSAAQNTIGCLYSTKLRKVFTRNEITPENGKWIDLAFFGINSSYSYCRFVSPDSAAGFTFPDIPGATHTAFVNTIEKSPLKFTVSDFDTMTTDTPLKELAIKVNDSGTAFFTNASSPYIVLFETQDGRKGAIKIKSFIANGAQSYILADIKVQKSN